MIFDLHVHTSISPCSQLTLDEIISYAQAKGLDGICITDHDTMAVNRLLREGPRDEGPCIIFGMEYATKEGDFLIFGPFENIRPHMAGPELLQHVESQGGVAVAAHPCRTGRSVSEDLIRGGLCPIMETTNGRNREWENRAASQLGDKYKAAHIGGSDAHTLSELGKIRTKFLQPIQCRADFIQALKNKAFSPLPHLAPA